MIIEDRDLAKASPRVWMKRGTKELERTMRIGWISAMLIALTLTGLGVVGYWAEPYETADARGVAPLRVNVIEAHPANSFLQRQKLIGRVENRRQSSVGFELGGKLDAVMADEGETVEAGQPLARLDTERLAAQRDELLFSQEQAEAELELARLTKERFEESVQTSAVTQQQLDEAVQNYQAKAAAVRALQARTRQVAIQLEKSTLRAPYDAVVKRRLVDEGVVISAGQPVLELVEAGRYEVRVGIPPRLAETLAVGDVMPVEIEGVLYDARVQARLPLQEETTRTVDVLFALDEGAAVQQGNLAVIWLEREVEKAGFWLPIHALTESVRGLWACYVVEDVDGRQVVRRKNVTIEYQRSQQVYVSGTLSPGDRVVRDGLHRLVPNQVVRIGPHQKDGSKKGRP